MSDVHVYQGSLTPRKGAQALHSRIQVLASSREIDGQSWRRQVREREREEEEMVKLDGAETEKSRKTDRRWKEKGSGVME